MNDMSEVERLVLNTVRDALLSGIAKMLDSGYSQPVGKIVEAVVTKHRAEIERRVESLILDALQSPRFDVAVREEFERKVAKVLIARCSGSVEKSINDVMQNPSLRARLVLAVEGIVKGGGA